MNTIEYYKDLDMEKLKYHPRTVELRFYSIMTVLEKTIGSEYVLDFITFICNRSKTKPVLIQKLFAERTLLYFGKDVKNDRVYKRQEIILANIAWGEKRRVIAERYLGMSPNTVYRYKEVSNPEYFYTEKFANRYLNNASVAINDIWMHDMIAFLDTVDVLTRGLKGD